MNNIFSKDKRTFWMGISIIWIILYHCCYFTTNIYSNSIIWKINNYLFHSGYLGVDIFLFLSSYGLCCSLSQNNIKKYFFNRFKRIYPLYFIFLILILNTFLSHYSLKDKIIAFILQGTGLSIFKFFQCNIEWYTPSIISLYIAFPLIFKFIKNNSFKIDVILYLLIFIISPIFTSYIYDNLAYRIPIIILGIFTYKYKDSKKLIHIYIIAAICSLLTNINTLQQSTYIPLILWAINHCISDINIKIPQQISSIGLFSFEIYLSQVICTKYYLPLQYLNNGFYNIVSTIILIIFITLTLHYCSNFLVIYTNKFYKNLVG